MQQKSNIFLTAKERLLHYLDFKGISQYQFSKSTGLANGFLKSGSGISSDNLKIILDAFGDINLIWVITGEGEMLIEKNGYLNGYPNGYLAEKSDKKNAQVDAQVEKKCIPECIPKCIPADKKAELALSREVPINVAHPVERGGIPLIPIEAAAGALSGPLQAMDFECEYYVIPSFKNAEFMIRITGDSMIPKYQAGDIVACQRLSLGTFFQWNNVYVVDSEQGALIKRVKRGSDKEHILLVSENQDYEPFELPLSEINGMGQVVGIVRLE